jgi:hypothetical protein
MSSLLIHADDGRNLAVHGREISEEHFILVSAKERIPINNEPGTKIVLFSPAEELTRPQAGDARQSQISVERMGDDGR